jgi:hypothetical protein
VPGVLAWVVAALIALPSLAYPFGRDQGVYFYVAREWLRRGAIPYRDSFDHKTPGIYVAHAVAIALFGEHAWGIRLLEVPVVAGIGWLAADVARPTRELRAPVRAMTVLATVILYFGHFGFWDTAQPEVWCAFFCIAALALALRSRGAWSAAACGALVGAGVLMKPSALPMGLVVAWALGGRRALPFAGGLAFVVATCAAYFAGHGALRTALQVVVGANLLYARNEHIGGVSDAITRLLDVTRQLFPTSLVLLYGVGYGWTRARTRGDRVAMREYNLVIAMGLAALAGVAMQLKFYTYHLILFLAPAAMAAAILVRDVLGFLSERGWSRARAEGIVAGHLVAFLALSWVGEHIWFQAARKGILLATGRIGESDYLKQFHVDPVRFDAARNEEVSRWLRDRARPDDRLCDRSFEPELYEQTGLRCGDRFFWTPWVADVHRQFQRDDWAAQDRESLLRSPPRFVTVKIDALQPINQEGYFLPLGYVRRAQLGTFLVLERDAEAPVTAAREGS